MYEFGVGAAAGNIEVAALAVELSAEIEIVGHAECYHSVVIVHPVARIYLVGRDIIIRRVAVFVENIPPADLKVQPLYGIPVEQQPV